MPVFWFTLFFVQNINIVHAAIAFFILHFLVYPSSNGYNSYMDRDEESIGGLQNPLQPTKQLFYVTVVLDVIAIALSLIISHWFALSIAVYIGFSRMYSYRGIRLKQYPLIGYFVVMLNQGTLTFFMVYQAASNNVSAIPLHGLVAATFLIGGFYPITQIYQHASDAKDKVTTISMLLGKRGTMVFCAAMYVVALSILWHYYFLNDDVQSFVVLQIFFVPVLVFFLRWTYLIWQNESAADFKHTMQMNWIASTCTSLAFITLIFLQTNWQT